MKDLKRAKYLFYVNIIYWIIYNTYFGWNYKPQSHAETVNDYIFHVITIICFMIFITPLIKRYIDSVKKLEAQKHWYFIELGYKVDGKKIFTQSFYRGFLYQDSVLNQREVKKSIGNLWEDKNIRPHLNNGYLYISDVKYLGHFTKNYKI